MANATAPLTIPEFLTTRLDDLQRTAESATVGGYQVAATMYLADIAAKRMILNLHSGDNDEQCQSWAGNWIHEPCATLKALASAYSDHPDYREEWKP